MGAVVGLELVGVEFDGFVVLGLNVGILDEVCFAVGVAVGIDEVGLNVSVRLMVDEIEVGTTEEEGLEVGIAVVGGLDGFAEVGLFVGGFTFVGLGVVGLGVLGFGEGFSDGRRVVGIRVVGLDVGVNETGDGKGPLTRTAI
jgi:hypothetical protein